MAKRKQPSADFDLETALLVAAAFWLWNEYQKAQAETEPSLSDLEEIHVDAERITDL